MHLCCILWGCVPYVSVVVLVISVWFLVWIFWTSGGKHPDLSLREHERYFLDSVDAKRRPFPLMQEKGTLDLSVIVPAYNEENRCEEKDPSRTFEVIIVDDGSRDRTTKTALVFTEKYGADTVRVLSLERNRGKGFAVKAGVISSRGRYILMVDADGATRFSDLHRVRDALLGLDARETASVVAVGSRAHLQEDAITQRSFLRNLLMHGFHAVLYVLFPSPIKDTQCGFKLFTRPAALLLFRNLHVNRWAFDVELVMLAKHFKMPMVEVPVNWKEIDGSKMIPVFSWLQMARDLLAIKLRYACSLWKIRESL